MKNYVIVMQWKTRRHSFRKKNRPWITWEYWRRRISVQWYILNTCSANERVSLDNSGRKLSSQNLAIKRGNWKHLLLLWDQLLNELYITQRDLLRENIWLKPPGSNFYEHEVQMGTTWLELYLYSRGYWIELTK